jgi:lipoprotein-anchoring transpeptidase ErfK/SrfK
MKRYNQPICSHSISRREFLKFSGMGIAATLGYMLPTTSRIANLLHLLDSPVNLVDLTMLIPNGKLAPNQQGRVLDDSIDVFDVPSYEGNRVRIYWKDQILPITEITVGKSIDSFNMVWYKVGNEGYVHSGSLQPVFTITNPVQADISSGGMLAEVTVPFTDAHWDPGQNEPVAYRFYYSTTYWVMMLVQDPEGNPWYGVRDDKWEYMFYVPAPHLRIVPTEELRPLSPSIPLDKKHIEVHLPQQVMVAYEYDRPVFMARVASGAVFSTGNYSTPAGKYQILHKRASRHMARGNLAANGYDLPGVPWNSYITEDGIAFHGTYWHNNFGHPRSHGCINLTSEAAKWVYRWSLPIAPADQEDVYKNFGTIVEVIE